MIGEVATIRETHPAACDICADTVDVEEWNDKPANVAAWVKYVCAKCRERTTSRPSRTPKVRRQRLHRWSTAELQ